MPTIRALTIGSLVTLLFTIWRYQVNQTVPEPYLDEVFHVGQAQAYCSGHYRRWDPKITTPPGLYLLSQPFLQLQYWLLGNECGVADLRWLNSLVANFVLPAQLLHLFKQSGLSLGNGQQDRITFHSVLNTCLFPVLFFFSGLYYTDVCSVSFVLAAYKVHHRCLRDASPSSAVKVFLLGLSSVMMRQTNIFWVAVYLAGLHAVHHVKKAGQPEADQSIGSPNVSDDIYDPLLRDAYLEDYIKTAVSLATAALRDPFSLLLSLWPYIALLASFSIFVLLNGGVVLGDKENHIASIHTAQMLYIWPYIVFFSWPIILPQIIHLLCNDIPTLKHKLPRPIIALPIMTLMALSVHFNTIIHPFTLADNRHYIFYVFRLLLLRNHLVKYAVIPIYFLCAWASITALGNHPPPSKPSIHPKNLTKDTSSNAQPNAVHVSFLLILLTTTALSLITAPLVEPRYCILPWLIWRLHAQPPTPSTHSPSPSPENPHPQPSERIVDAVRWLARLDASTWLYVETGWFLLVNLVTGWVFLRCGFEWESEPGRVQRFMW